MKGEMGSILLNRGHSVPKIGRILSTAEIFYLGFFFHNYCFSLQRVELPL